jgi:hypothetical protein
LWFFNIFQSTRELFYGVLFRGIAGNWNWNAALIIVTTPFAMLVVAKMFQTLKIPRKYCILINLFLVILSLYYVYRCDSKGAWLGLFVALGLLLLLTGKIPFRIFLFSIPLLLIGIIFFIYAGGINIAASFLANDIRLYLWKGTCELIRQNWLWGIWQPMFENCYASYNPPEYYLSVFAAERNINPHNHLLYFMASNGVIAFFAWLFMLLYPLIALTTDRMRSCDLKLKLYLFIYLFLLVMGMFDIVLDNWPLNVIFLVVTGILWGKCWVLNRNKLVRLKWFKVVMIVTGVFFLGLAIFDAGRNAASSYCFRNVRIAMDEKNKLEAMEWCKSSIAIKPGTENIYQSALIAFYDMKNPVLCLYYLDMLNNRTGFSNYVHNNGLRAKALCVSGQPRDAIIYFEREGRNFPLSAINWYFYLQTLKTLGMREQCNIVSARLQQVLELRGLRIEQLPVLMKNPNQDWDLNGVIESQPANLRK